MRFVITEQEKKQILSLYEIENPYPPDEWEIVDWINPFRDTKYLPYAKVYYSKNLNDGDLFYGLMSMVITGKEFEEDNLKNECLNNFRNKIKPNFSDLIGKTVRFDNVDSIGKIQDLYFVFGEGLIEPGSHYLYLQGLNSPDDLIPTDVRIKFENNNTTSSLSSRFQALPIGLKKEIESRLPKITAKDLPDCIFSLKRVKRKKTDFLP